MPLVLQNAKPRVGDLMVSYEVDYIEDEERDEIYPSFEVYVSEFRGAAHPILNRFWGGEIDITMWNVIHRASYFFSALDRYHRFWKKPSYVDAMPQDLFLGSVCGKLNTDDEGEVRDYIKRVVRHYRPMLDHEMREMMYDFIGEDLF